jgi:3-oxoacyl-[acyl-carrier-protein] synthase II
MQLKRVVVTGIGALTPIGNNATDYWNALLNGVSGADFIKRFDASKHKTKFACEVKNFEVTNFIDRKEARKMDPFAQFAVVCADETLKDSGIDPEKINKDRAGVIWASGIGGLHTFQEEVMSFAKGDGTPRFNPFFIPKMILDIAAGHISMRYGFRGVNYATVSACASSSHAMINAFDNIRMGRADFILTGGDYDFLLLSVCENLRTTGKHRLSPGIWYRAREYNKENIKHVSATPAEGPSFSVDPSGA